MPSFGSHYDVNEAFLSGGDNDMLGSVSATEETPLLETLQTERSLGTTATDFTTIVLLVLVLLAGMSIGVYLLVLQHKAENVLPPVDKSHEAGATRVNGTDRDLPGLSVLPAQPLHAETVIIDQTGTEECQNLETCAPILRLLRETDINDSLSYNYLLSSDGTAYEGLGLTKLSTLQPELKPLALAFIGNFTTVAPSTDQVIMAKSLIYDFIKRDILVKNHTITGNLYGKIKDSPEWKEIGSGLIYSI